AGYNHRLYAMTTRDWKTFSEPKLWFDPGFNAIDGTLAYDGKRYFLIFKDERKTPLMKRLRLASSESPTGPFREIPADFPGNQVEGPSAIRIGAEWWIYFDHYTLPRYYGAVRTKDWKTFEDVTAKVSFPPDHRHGTVVKITSEEARILTSHAKASGPSSAKVWPAETR
ncbi:MAG: hypothetical protein H7039_16990, partial [Bryobacteraceae bacterium]|nr:hypothetical protein [Bryobacteraceae bacterium]